MKTTVFFVIYPLVAEQERQTGGLDRLYMIMGLKKEYPVHLGLSMLCRPQFQVKLDK